MRQQYIDILKGFTIIWVLWMHMDMPELIYPSVQMPIFFFLSGAFYRAKGNFVEQMKGDAYRLLLPTVCFMTIAAILMTMRGDDIWSWNVLDVLQTCRNGSITWFLIALFCFRACNYPFERFNKRWAYVALATILYPIGYVWKVKFPDVVVPIIPATEMMMFGIYYAMGYAIGKKVLTHTGAWGGQLIAVSITCVAYLTFVHLMNWESGILSRVPWLVYGFPYTLACIYMGLVISRQLEKSLLITRPLAYVGRNSIVFYLTHFLLYIYIFKGHGYNPYLVFCTIVLIEFPLIYIITNYLPWIVGQKKK